MSNSSPPAAVARTNGNTVNDDSGMLETLFLFYPSIPPSVSKELSGPQPASQPSPTTMKAVCTRSLDTYAPTQDTQFTQHICTCTETHTCLLMYLDGR